MTVVILALFCGAVVGVALGALGGGGGVLAVPALVYLLGVTPADAGTTSLAIVTATSVTALVRHSGTGNIDWRTGTLFAATGVLPAIGASVLTHRIPQAVLTSAFAVLAAVAAAAMLRGARAARPARPVAASPVPAASTAATGQGGADATASRPTGGTILADQEEDASCWEPGMARPEPAPGAGRAGPTPGRNRWPRTSAAGAGLGAVTGLLGVGGGFLVVPALVSVLRLPMRKAACTSLVVILINSVVSLATRLAVGGDSLDLAIFFPFVGAGIVGAWEGKRLASRLSGAALQGAFAALLIAVAAFMLVGVLA
ncbi:sulfite exporter TauE/SafE family protein [Actinomadura harenae]|uniref:Probable membrane transporter protein n=1 Tax=Actinomadura harenae TaxID=2483351 RepID=A0A3M2MFU5_9ACTN|nr:sulfite exporter TauE/SafE family protein [Actinomadura harenae]RMI46118.1 sulfite exporter TauE/SafE family protein [Actinomadura harenae]